MDGAIPVFILFGKFFREVNYGFALGIGLFRLWIDGIFRQWMWVLNLLDKYEIQFNFQVDQGSTGPKSDILFDRAVRIGHKYKVYKFMTNFESYVGAPMILELKRPQVLPGPMCTTNFRVVCPIVRFAHPLMYSDFNFLPAIEWVGIL